MWWVDRFGSVSGPYSDEQIRKGIERLQFTRYNRISSDRKTWIRIDGTEFWRFTSSMPIPVEMSAQFVAASEKLQMRRGGTAVGGGDAGSDRSPQRETRIGARPLPGRMRRRLRRNGAIVALIVAGAVAVAGVWILVFPGAKAPIGARGNDADFERIKDRVVLVKTEEGSGTAFLVKMGGKKYALTNDHVVRSENPPRMTLVDGTELALGRMSVAKDRDLARFEVECERDCFALSSGQPSIGDQILVYGNSVGDNVITRLSGEISGVGPRDIKITANIVGGNSGSPVVGQDGDVVAVASYLRNGANGKDWITRGTEFDQPRRFGIRLQNVEWVEVNTNEYMRGVAVLNLVKKYLMCLHPFVWCHRLSDSEIKKCRTEYDDYDDGMFDGDDGKACAEMLIELSKVYAEMRNGGGTGVRRNFYAKCKESLIVARQILDGFKWPSPLMEHGYGKDSYEDCADLYGEYIDVSLDENSKRLRKLN